MGFWSDLAAWFTPTPVGPRDTPSSAPVARTRVEIKVTPPAPHKVSPAAKAGAAIAMATAMIASFEGLRTKVYLDIGGVPTVCYGETVGIHNRIYTASECLALLQKRIPDYNTPIRRCVTAPMRASREAALTSFAYNVGVSAACRSTAVRLLNTGDDRGGCEALMMWNKVAGVAVRGLTNRRAIERTRCLANED